MRDFRSKVRCSAATVAYGVLASALWDALKFFIEQLSCSLFGAWSGKAAPFFLLESLFFVVCDL